MSEASYYNWKTKYTGLTISELKRLKALEEENRRLKQIVAEQALDNRAIKELLSKHFIHNYLCQNTSIYIQERIHGSITKSTGP